MVQFGNYEITDDRNLLTQGLFIWEEVIPVSEKTFRLAK
jgi:hypothetical protein